MRSVAFVAAPFSVLLLSDIDLLDLAEGRHPRSKVVLSSRLCVPHLGAGQLLFRDDHEEAVSFVVGRYRTVQHGAGGITSGLAALPAVTSS